MSAALSDSEGEAPRLTMESISRFASLLLEALHLRARAAEWQLAQRSAAIFSTPVFGVALRSPDDAPEAVEHPMTPSDATVSAIPSVSAILRRVRSFIVRPPGFVGPHYVPGAGCR